MRKKSRIFVILAGILWGTTGIFVKLLSEYGFNSVSLTSFRGLIAFTCIAVFCLLRDRSAFRIKKADRLLYAGIGLTQFATAGCYFVSMQMTSVSTAVILMYTAPIYVTLFSVFVWKERFSYLKGLAVAGMLIGCVFVSGVIGGGKFNALGVAVGIISGITYGGYSILSKKALLKGYSPLSTVLYGSLSMGVLGLPATRPDVTAAAFEKSPLTVLLLLLGLGIITFFLPFFLYNKGLEKLPAGTASSLSVIEPMAAAIFSVLIFHESLDVISVIGIGLIMLSVVLLGIADKPEKSKN